MESINNSEMTKGNIFIRITKKILQINPKPQTTAALNSIKKIDLQVISLLVEGPQQKATSC